MMVTDGQLLSVLSDASSTSSAPSSTELKYEKLSSSYTAPRSNGSGGNVSNSTQQNNFNPSKSMSSVDSSSKSSNLFGRENNTPIGKPLKTAIYSSEGVYRFLKEYTPKTKAFSKNSTFLSYDSITENNITTNYIMYNIDNFVIVDKYDFASPKNIEKEVDTKAKSNEKTELFPKQTSFRSIPSCHLFFIQNTVEGLAEELDFHNVKTEKKTIQNVPNVKILVAFQSGDFLFFNPWRQTTVTHINNQNSISKSSANVLLWVPKKEGSNILCGMKDGSILEMSIFNEDPKSSTPAIPPFKIMSKNCHKGIFSYWKNLDHNSNPVTKFQVSESPINDMKFSPNGKILAVVSGEGLLRLIDFDKFSNPELSNSHQSSVQTQAPTTNQNENSVHFVKCLSAFKSYYAGFLCVSWSPDGKFLITGGEDDYVSLWSIRGPQIVARCQGHRSWVSGVAFDPWNCKDGQYRFGSVGQDMRLMLWDYSSETLSRPRSSSNIGFRSKNRSVSVENYSNSKNSDDNIVIPAKGRKEVPIIEATVDQRIHHYPVQSILFLEKAFLTAGDDTAVKVWARPQEYPEENDQKSISNDDIIIEEFPVNN